MCMLPLAAAFYVNLSGYRVIHGIAIFLVGMMLLTRRSQARLASVRAKEGIKLWKSLLTSVRSDWRQRSANANGCTYSINLLKEHLSSLNISQTEANINKEIITSKNHVVSKHFSFFWNQEPKLVFWYWPIPTPQIPRAHTRASSYMHVH